MQDMWQMTIFLQFLKNFEMHTIFHCFKAEPLDFYSFFNIENVFVNRMTTNSILKRIFFIPLLYYLIYCVNLRPKTATY